MSYIRSGRDVTSRSNDWAITRVDVTDDLLQQLTLPRPDRPLETALHDADRRALDAGIPIHAPRLIWYGGDAMAEGCPFQNMARGEDPRVWYEDLWCDLNGAVSWRANPWVWVVTFRRVEP